ncbi:MAG: RNA polymerase sigma factor [Ferruginibacter sp.]|nr:RNA polymerase sigma factor [Cytophagales bacterium]
MARISQPGRNLSGRLRILPVVHDNSQDLALLDRILAGDQTAYRTLIERHKSYAFTIAYRILRHREDAEEVAQDAFMKAFQSLTGFNREAKFTTWFYRIVFNAALGHQRRRQLPTTALEETPDHPEAATPADQLAAGDKSRYIQLAMNQLPPDDVTMLTLFYLREFSLEEMAAVTGIAANTIKIKLHRARKRLAEKLGSLLKDEIHAWR